MKKIKAAFFDRDGTLIEDVSYLSRLDQIKLIPESIELCRNLQASGYTLFVVTNQSGIARGYFDEAFVQKTHQHLHKILYNEGITITGWYYCPHHPEYAILEHYKKNCSCRKPEPGMLLQASADFNVDLTQSLMFGDKEGDLHAGIAAGCKSFDINEATQGLTHSS